MSTENNDKNDTTIDLDADQVVEQSEQSSLREQPSSAKGSKRRSGWLLAGVAVVAAAVSGGWFYKDVLSTYFPSDQTKVLADKIAVLENSNTALRDQLSSVDKLTKQLKTDVDGLEAKDAALSGLAEEAQKAQGTTAEKLNALKQDLAAAQHLLAQLASRPGVSADGAAAPVEASAVVALQQRIDALEKDVESLKVKPAEAADNKAALTQALSDLKAKVAAGVGYREELDRIQRMVPASSGMDVLQQQAALGLPDAKGLGAELKSIISTLPKPIIPGPVPESEGWWAGLVDSLSGLITIRVEGDVDWPSAAAAAAALADSGDLTQAIDHLNKIEAAKPVGIQQWVDRASARLSVETALQSVEDAVLRVIAAKG